MTARTTRQWRLAKKPTGLAVLSGSESTFRLDSAEIPSLQNDQMLVKILHLSNEPAQRLWIDPNIPPERLYTKPVEVGDVVASFAAVAEVVESNSSIYPVGALVSAMTGWTEYAVVAANDCMPVASVGNSSPATFAGVFGITGMSAYYGLVDIGNVGPDDAVVVSGAAGAVGSTAVQVAKKVLGCRKVIGIAGTDDKCRWVETLGADACLNYKSSTFEADLKKAADGFVEVFFDNVGGTVLDFMLTLMQKNGRVIACGAISNYNDSDSVGIKNWYDVIAMRLRILGFVVTDALESGRLIEIQNNLIQCYKEGKIEASEDGVTIVPTSFEDIPKTWMLLFTGQNQGKLLTQLVDSKT